MTENTLEEQIYQFIKEKNLLKAGDVCIVGVSGGADSICLLTVLAGLREKMELKLYAVHVNHMIRGTEADADESYVAEYCKKLGIPCDCYHIDVPQLAKEQKLAEEEAGRNARYEAFARAADKYGITDYKVAVAHNKNDVAETVLLNMVRGTGIAGMAGIPVKRDRIVRPLLSCTRQEIEAYLEQQEIQYCTDSTNLENDYARNKIRNRVIPALNEINTQAAAHISQAAAYAAMYDTYVTKQVGYFLDEHMEIRKQTGKTDAYVLEIRKLREQDELIEDLNIPDGDFDTAAECRYTVPSATSIGMLYQGLVLSTMKDEDAAQAILDVFSSFITDEISDFNSNVYYTNPDYLRCSYLEGKMLA